MKHRIFIAGVICLVCVVVFCYITTTGGIIKLDELPLNFMITFLGAIVTAVITLFLLYGQTCAEEIKERNVRVFNIKSEIYENYKNRLYEILQEQKINGNTYKEIIFEYNRNLMLYLNKKSQWKITNHFINLAECVGIEMNDKNISDDEINKNYIKFRNNIFSIIDILIKDLGLGGKMFINKQNDLERKSFPYISGQILLEEIDKIFMIKDNTLFEKACFCKCIDGIFVNILIKGNMSPGGWIEIGPFDNNSPEKKEKLILRLLVPYYKMLPADYTSKRKANIDGKYIIFYNDEPINENIEYDQIDLTFFNDANLENLLKCGINKEDIYKKDIYQFGFDDSTYNQYGGFYVSICKTIAARAFYHFSNAKAKGKKDNLQIKKLCEKFGKVTFNDYIRSDAQEQGIDLDN
jgi:hypothetical protein